MIAVPLLLTGAILSGLYATRGPVDRLYQGKRYYVRFPQRTPPVAREEFEAELRESAAPARSMGLSDLSVGDVDSRYATMYFRWTGEEGTDVTMFRQRGGDGPYEVIW